MKKNPDSIFALKKSIIDKEIELALRRDLIKARIAMLKNSAKLKVTQPGMLAKSFFLGFAINLLRPESSSRENNNSNSVLGNLLVSAVIAPTVRRMIFADKRGQPDQQAD